VQVGSQEVELPPVELQSVQPRLVEFRPWQCGDEVLAAAAAEFMSTTSLANRFLAGTGGRLPAGYLRHIAKGSRPTWDAYVAATDDHLIGWAEFGRIPEDSPTADLAVIVADPWQRRGIASALIRALLPRVAAAGVTHLGADTLPGNRAIHGLLASLFGTRLDVTYEGGVVHYSLLVATARPTTPTIAPSTDTRRLVAV
jgi:GNAT superfamily N-acetyltransferase